MGITPRSAGPDLQFQVADRIVPRRNLLQQFPAEQHRRRRNPDRRYRLRGRIENTGDDRGVDRSRYGIAGPRAARRAWRDSGPGTAGRWRREAWTGPALAGICRRGIGSGARAPDAEGAAAVARAAPVSSS